MAQKKGKKQQGGGGEWGLKAGGQIFQTLQEEKLLKPLKLFKLFSKKKNLNVKMEQENDPNRKLRKVNETFQQESCSAADVQAPPATWDEVNLQTSC